MANKKNTRRALFTSIMSLILCCALLVGTTFAWFTDEVTNSGNIIKSGTLDVTMHWAEGTEDPANANWKDASTGTIFNCELWEPGHTEVRHIQIKNEGSLALKYQLTIQANGEVSKLSDVIDVYYVDPAVQVADRAALNAGYKLGTLTEVLGQLSETATGNLLPGGSETLTLALKMQESATNEYQNLSIGSDFAVVLLATQYTHEEDTFGNDYDTNATYSGVGEGTASGTQPSAAEVPIYDDTEKLGTAVIPAEAMANAGEKSKVVAEKTSAHPNITIAAGRESLAYDIQVTNLKEGNTNPVKVTMYIGEMLDPETVAVYHYDQPIASNYNPYTGYVTFESATFSPFTILYDADSVYVAPEVDEDTVVPVANVVKSAEYENTDLPWGSYGQWSPTAGLESTLEAAYTFTAEDTYDEAVLSPFANWYCDFYVKLDQDLGKNEIFLGGNYGSFGWVGFHNGDLTLAANTEIPLLGSVTSNPWTYTDVVNYVGEFICGVGDVNDALVGATFTVTLRLTNPENENDIRDVAVISHTFVDTKLNSAEELKAALAAGGDIKLDGNITVTETITVPSGVTANLDLNGYTIAGVNSATATHNDVFLVKGNLTVSNGTVTMKHDADNMGWNGGNNVFDVTAGGVLNVYNAWIENLGGTDMNFAIHMNNWGTATINVKSSTLKATYIPVRVFNSGPDMNNVTIENTDLVGGSYCFWVHNYGSSDLGGKVYSNAAAAYDEALVAARLNFDIYGNNNTFTTPKAAPVRYGFNESILYNADGSLYVAATA